MWPKRARHEAAFPMQRAGIVSASFSIKSCKQMRYFDKFFVYRYGIEIF